MSSDDFVSVIMPTYNHGHLIADSIQSVINQTHHHWELLIVNNYSNDDTIDVVNNFNDERIRVINFFNNGIIASSRNVGIRESNGEYLAFLDSDDLWVPDKLEKQLKVFEKNKKIVLCSSNCDQFPIGQKNMLKMFTSKYVRLSKLFLRNDVLNSSVILKRKIINEIGYLNESSEIRTVEDFHYWIKIAIHYPNAIFIMKDRLLKYRIHGSNQSGNTIAALVEKHNKIMKIIQEYKATIDVNSMKIEEKLKKRFNEEILRTNFYNNKNFSILMKSNEVSFFTKFFIVFKYFVRKFWT